MDQKNVSTSFRVMKAPESWLKYTTLPVSVSLFISFTLSFIFSVYYSIFNLCFFFSEALHRSCNFFSGFHVDDPLSVNDHKKHSNWWSGKSVLNHRNVPGLSYFSISCCWGHWFKVGGMCIYSVCWLVCAASRGTF